MERGMEAERRNKERRRDTVESDGGSETKWGRKILHACLWKLDTNRLREKCEIHLSLPLTHTHTHTGVEA